MDSVHPSGPARRAAPFPTSNPPNRTSALPWWRLVPPGRWCASPTEPCTCAGSGAGRTAAGPGSSTWPGATAARSATPGSATIPRKSRIPRNLLNGRLQPTRQRLPLDEPELTPSRPPGPPHASTPPRPCRPRSRPGSLRTGLRLPHVSRSSLSRSRARRTVPGPDNDDHPAGLPSKSAGQAGLSHPLAT